MKLPDFQLKTLRPRGIVGRIGAVALALALLAGLGVVIAWRVSALPSDAALEVYGTVITKSELKHRQELLKALYGIEAPTDPKQRDSYQRQCAEAVALSVVLDRAARDEAVVVSDKDAQQMLMQLISSRFPDGQEGFVRLLGEVGASEQDVLDELKRQRATRLLFDKVVARQGSEGQVTEARARAYYDQNPGQFVAPEARHLRNIVLASRDDADQVAQQARAGADFATLTKEFSMDQSTRDTGGDLGFVRRDQLEAPFADAAFAAPVGQVFGPVRTEHGWDVGQVLEVRPPAPLPWDQVKDQLRSELSDRNALAFWRGWATQRIKDAHIRYAEDYRPADADVPLNSPAAGPAQVRPPAPAPPPAQAAAPKPVAAGGGH